MSDIANTTFNQIGGRQAMVLIGGRASCMGDTLNIQFKGCRKSNVVKIEYSHGLDLYTMTFYKMAKYELKEVSKHEELYCDMLINIFEEETGLFLTLFPRK